MTNVSEIARTFMEKGVLFIISSLNPLSPNSDHHRISPCNINAYSTTEAMRIKDMNTRGGI